jgi:predicted N-acyltransferase
MSYLVQIIDDLGSLQNEIWNSAAPQAAFHDAQWMRFAQQIIKDFRPLCALLMEGEQVVGTASFVLSNDPGVTLESGFGRYILQTLLKRYPLLLCQTPIANKSGLVLPVGHETEGLLALDSAVRAHIGRYHTSFLVYGWLSEAEKVSFERSGKYNVVALDSGMSLKIQWANFEDYHKTLSRTMRRNVKRHDKAATEMGIRLERTHHFAHETPHMMQLVHNVWQHHGNDFAFPYRDDMFATVERDLPNNSIMIFARQHDQIVGLGLLIWDKDVMTWAMLGLDYSVRYVYFQIIYEAIRVAIDLGIKTIQGGTGAYEFKRRLGFTEQPSQVAFGASLPILRWFANRLAPTVVRDTGEDENEGANTVPASDTAVNLD